LIIIQIHKNLKRELHYSSRKLAFQFEDKKYQLLLMTDHLLALREIFKKIINIKIPQFDRSKVLSAAENEGAKVRNKYTDILSVNSILLLKTNLVQRNIDGYNKTNKRKRKSFF
jgi:hypothetical protein